MANYFSGYSGDQPESSSGVKVKAASAGKKSFFKGYTGAAYDPNFTADTAPAAAKTPSKGSWGGIFSGIKDFIGNDIVKPVVDSSKSAYHGVKAADMAILSVAKGHHGEQLAKDKQAVIDEFRHTSEAKVAPELVSGKVNSKTGKLEGADLITGTTVRKAAGAVGEDALNLGSVIPAGKAVTVGKDLAEAGVKAASKKFLTEGVKTGAKYGAGYGVTGTLQQDKITAADAAKNVGEGALIGGAAGGVLEGAGRIAGKSAAKGAKAVTEAFKASPEVSDAVVTRIAPVAEGDTQQSILNRHYVAKHYETLKLNVQKAATGMSEKDIKLLEAIETTTKKPEYAAAKVNRIAKTADNPEQFRTVVAALREAYNSRLASDRALGRDVGFLHNYLPHIYDTGDKSTAKALQRLRLTADSTPGYVKGRVIPTYAEADRLAAEAGLPQLKRANANVLEDFYQSMDRASSDHGSAVLKQGLEQAHPGVPVGVGKIGYDPQTGQHYEQLKITGAKNLSLPSELAAEYNKRAQPEASNTALRAYDKGNAVVKTSVLGGGFFHALTTAGTATGQQIVRAALHPTEVPRMVVHNLRVIGGTISKGQHASNMEFWTKSGVVDFAQRTGATLGDSNPDVINPHTHIPVISNIHDMIFRRQIPSVKLMMIEQEMEHKFPGIDFKNPTTEQIAWGRDVASGVNNIGYINRAIEGLSPKAAKQLGRIILAPDFTEGKFRTIYNALHLTRNSPRERLAREMVVGKSVLFALPGLVALTAAGKIDWNDPKDVASNITDQLLDPQVSLGFKGKGSKTNPDGTPQSVHLPSTFISELGKVFKPMFVPTDGNRMAGIESYASNRVAALPGAASKLYNNKDFYGKPIYGNDETGKPLSAAQTAGNIVGLVGPIPGQQAVKQATGQQGLETTVLNTLGGRVSNDTSSAEAGKSADVNKLYTAYNSASKNKIAVSKQVQSLVAEGKINQAHRVANDWNARLADYERNYPDQFGDQAKKAWDDKWGSLQIKTSSRADLTRKRNAKTNTALLNLSE
jgi:hypothetical protein